MKVFPLGEGKPKSEGGAFGYEQGLFHRRHVRPSDFTSAAVREVHPYETLFQGPSNGSLTNSAGGTSRGSAALYSLRMLRYLYGKIEVIVRLKVIEYSWASADPSGLDQCQVTPACIY